MNFSDSTEKIFRSTWLLLIKFKLNGSSFQGNFKFMFMIKSLIHLAKHDSPVSPKQIWSSLLTDWQCTHTNYAGVQGSKKTKYKSKQISFPNKNKQKSIDSCPCCWGWAIAKADFVLSFLRLPSRKSLTYNLTEKQSFFLNLFLGKVA